MHLAVLRKQHDMILTSKMCKIPNQSSWTNFREDTVFGNVLTCIAPSWYHMLLLSATKITVNPILSAIHRNRYQT